MSIEKKEDINVLLQRLVNKKAMEEKRTQDILRDARIKEQKKMFGFGNRFKD